jgi:hypothetical protein
VQDFKKQLVEERKRTQIQEPNMTETPLPAWKARAQKTNIRAGHGTSPHMCGIIHTPLRAGFDFANVHLRATFCVGASALPSSFPSVRNHCPPLSLPPVLSYLTSFCALSALPSLHPLLLGRHPSFPLPSPSTNLPNSPSSH